MNERAALSEREVLVPDIGDFKDVEVIDVLVAAGDKIKEEDSLITLESDKASMDVPSPMSGTVKNVLVKTGDKVSEGSKILVVETAQPTAPTRQPERPQAEAPAAKPEATSKPALASKPSEQEKVEAPPQTKPQHPAQPQSVDETAFAKAHASPSVRRYARELGADLGQIRGSGPKGRILKEDVQGYVKSRLSAPQTAAFGLPVPDMDFSRFGPTQNKPLSRIQKISAANLQRNWQNIPHVTQFDQADITELEAFRKQAQERQKEVKLTLLPFLLKACAAALKFFPQVNASLHPEGDQLILKQYVHIGVAVDTPDGLLVPVLRDVDKKGAWDLARELKDLSDKARAKKLSPGDLQGASFSISNLGGIGGTAFTPIINAPEVAILGVSRSTVKPVYKDGDLAPRLMLPVSFSYDHRAVDGADAARFTAYLCEVLADVRKLLL